MKHITYFLLSTFFALTLFTQSSLAESQTVSIDAYKTVTINGFRHANWQQGFNVYRKLATSNTWDIIGRYTVDNHTKFTISPISVTSTLRIDAFNRRNSGSDWRASKFFNSRTDGNTTWLYWDDKVNSKPDIDLEIVIAQD